MPLTARQQAELVKLIEQRRRALIDELRQDIPRSRDAPYAEHAGNTPDAGDQSVADLLADLGEADTMRDLDELRAVEAARERLQEGSYGTCADCRADIDFDRLRPFPAAMRCVRCQQRHEHTYAGAAKPSI